MTAPNPCPRAQTADRIPAPDRGGRRPVRRLAGLLAATATAAGLSWIPTAAPVGASVAAPATASAPAAPTQSNFVEAAIAGKINEERSRAGLAELWIEGVLIDQGRAWSSHMSRTGLAHHPNLAAEADYAYAYWTNYGENVGVGHDLGALHQRFMSSSRHRANVLGDYRAMGVGTEVDADGRVWVTVRFLK